jgi:hypothetical protein
MTQGAAWLGPARSGVDGLGSPSRGVVWQGMGVPRHTEDGRLIYLAGEHCPGTWHCHVYRAHRSERLSLCGTMDWRKFEVEMDRV